MEPLWWRLMAFARKNGLSYGMGVDPHSPGIFAFIGNAMGTGPTSNEAINMCADRLSGLYGWEDDRG